MKILICTQTVDYHHPILGFFHSWLLEFAKHCEEVHVICLREGSHDLPQNVHIHSLGKEAGVGTFTYVMRFYRYVWKFRREYDVVFVHMNQVYVLLGWPLWILFRKKIGLWYMHKAVDWSLRVSEKCVDHVFTASAESFRIKSTKVSITGHGINVETFAESVGEKDIELLTVGRITRSKNLLFLVSVLKALHENGQKLSLTIIGSPTTSEEELYAAELNAYIKQLELEPFVHLIGAVPNAYLSSYVGRAKVFVHAARNGSLDKALLEPLLMRVPVITSAEGAASLPLGDWLINEEAEQFVKTISAALLANNQVKLKELQRYVSEQHSLQNLIPKIIATIY